MSKGIATHVDLDDYNLERQQACLRNPQIPKKYAQPYFSGSRVSEFSHLRKEFGRWLSDDGAVNQRISSMGI
jgi:hypothetical protein